MGFVWLGLAPSAQVKRLHQENYIGQEFDEGYFLILSRRTVKHCRRHPAYFTQWPYGCNSKQNFRPMQYDAIYDFIGKEIHVAFVQLKARC